MASTSPSTLHAPVTSSTRRREARMLVEVADVALAAGDQVVDADHLGAVGEQAVGEV